MEYWEKTLNSEEKYQGIIVRVRLDEVELHTGRKSWREVVEHPGGVGLLPIDDEGNCYVVRQFRYPFGRMLLEIPAGKREKGEDPLVCAVRELSEETGLEAGELVDLGACYTSPGFCTEVLYVYLALDLKAGRSHPDEGEYLNVEKIPLRTLSEMVMRNEIADAKTVIAVLKAEKYLREHGKKV